MSRLRIVLFVLVVCACTGLSGVHAEMSSTNYKITSSVLSGGGTVMSSTNYHLLPTLGQSTPAGKISSANYGLDAGFWYTMLVDTVGDVNGDGSVDLEDVIAALHIITGQSPGTIIQEADADGDGKIGLGEAFHILRKLNE